GAECSLKELELPTGPLFESLQGNFRINYKKRELPSVVQQHCVGALGKNAAQESEP
ncbi:hypothetical protein PIB30_084231, partial [Stylosanthes scabra]|nr:hypothetical protein [Stylosanthes scabra]